MKPPTVAALLSLALIVLGPTPSSAARARAEAAVAEIEIATRSYPLERRARLAAVAVVWSGLEGGFHASPPGFNDAGMACGILQVHAPQTVLPGATCAKVRADLALGIRVGLALIDRLWTKCGSLGAAMTAFSTGQACPRWTLPLVAKRCKLAGLTSTCEVRP